MRSVNRGRWRADLLSSCSGSHVRNGGSLHVSGTGMHIFVHVISY
jgi:hypothetical protein